MASTTTSKRWSSATRTQVESSVRTARETFGRIDVLVDNAGTEFVASNR